MYKVWIILFVICLPISAQDNYKKFYYPNNQLSSEGIMVNNMPIGTWKSYHVNGELKSIGKWNGGKLDSVWTFYNDKGYLVKKIDYHNGKKNGWYIEYFTNPEQPVNIGKIKSRELYLNDAKNGKAFYFHEYGSVESVINFENGKKEGYALYFKKDKKPVKLEKYANNRLVESDLVNQFKNSNKDGIWINLDENYNVVLISEYKDGQKYGYEKVLDKNGNLVSVSYYEKGKIESTGNKNNVKVYETSYKKDGYKVVGNVLGNNKVGIHKYYNNGKIEKAEEYNINGQLEGYGGLSESGHKTGEWVYFDSLARKTMSGTYKDGKRHGKWIFYYTGNNIKQTGNYYNGFLNGEWIWFYPNGDTLRLEEYSRGKENGLYWEFNDEGKKIVDGFYIDGEKDGKWYYNVGDITEEGQYVFGLKNGKWAQWYSNGNKRYEGNYIQGNAEGKHKFYYPDGTLMEEQYYISGYKEGNWKKYDKAGNVKLVITYENSIETRINGQRIELEKDEKIIR